MPPALSIQEYHEQSLPQALELSHKALSKLQDIEKSIWDAIREDPEGEAILKLLKRQLVTGREDWAKKLYPMVDKKRAAIKKEEEATAEDKIAEAALEQKTEQRKQKKKDKRAKYTSMAIPPSIPSAAQRALPSAR